MEYYFAPMEGLTDSVYRRLHHKFFSGVDKYYMPFFSPTVHRSLTGRRPGSCLWQTAASPPYPSC